MTDNGLPPAGTDISGDSITGVAIFTEELIESEGGRVTGVMIDRELTGKSLIFYL